MTACAVGVVGLLLPAATARAQDPPHWASATVNIDCTSQCHLAHQALGGSLTQAASNDNLCQSCHVSSGLAADLPINDVDRADRAAGTGSSHAFDVLAVQGALDTQLPLDNEMRLRVKCTTDPCPDEATRAAEGRMICSTCHNQHRATSDKGGESRIGNPKVVNVAGDGSIFPGGTFTGAEGVWYLIDITTQGTDTSAIFRYSKDNGITWFAENLTASNDPGNPVPLDSGVTVYFAGTDFQIGDQWEFSAAWPFLRAELDSSVDSSGSFLCRDCHRAWDMDHTAVETYDTPLVKSHPVGVALNVNNEGYDRTVPLDANGADQGSVDADGNPTNDLVFDGTGVVQCLTCHGVHFVDTNSQTVDSP